MKKILLLAVGAYFLTFGAAVAGVSKIDAGLARLKSSGDEYTFAIFGDNRSGDNIYKKIIAQTLTRKPLFIVNTGDLIPNPGDLSEWKNFWKISASVTVPYFLTVGNHDIDSTESQKVWRDEVDLPGNETYYSFQVGPDLFVVLNTCDPDSDRKITGEQLAWLKRTLDKNKYRYQFVFVHHPLFLWKEATHYKGSLDKYPVFRDELHRLFVDRGVDAVFAGHEHTYRDQGQIDGIHYFVTGGAGAPKYGKGSFNNVMIVDVKKDGVIRAKVVDKDGYLRDELFIKSPAK